MNLIRTIASLVFDIVCQFWQAFVFMKLWGWFVVPLGVVPLNMALAYGIILIVSRCTNHNQAALLDRPDAIETALTNQGYDAILWLFALGLGAFASQFV